MKLSICIPTHNLGTLIGETLHSIIPQLNDDVEVVVLDGASTDNTEKIVRSYQERYPKVCYFRQPERGGVDKDIHLSVEKAHGEYCWLFSSNDVMKKGAIAQILHEIKLGLDVYLCNLTRFSREMGELPGYSFSVIDKPTIFDFTDPDLRRKYFESSGGLPFLFSCISTIIVKRKRWLETQIDPSFLGSGIAHATRILSMIPEGLQLKYIPTTFFLKRVFNPSFIHNGSVHQISMKVDGYLSSGRIIFGSKSLENLRIQSTLQKDFFIHYFLKEKARVANFKDITTLFRLMYKVHQKNRIMKLILFLMIFMLPDFLVRFLRRAFLKLKKVINQRIQGISQKE